MSLHGAEQMAGTEAAEPAEPVEGAEGTEPLRRARERRGRAPRLPRGSRASRPPRPPSRPPREPAPPIELSTRDRHVRGAIAVCAVLLLAFTLNLFLFSPLQHIAQQQIQHNTFRAQLAEGTAPVAEGTFDDVLLRDGEPVAIIEIPQIGVSEVVGEGTSASVLMSGPGHRRDTMLPGQQGVSVVMGRASAYGGPFGNLQELEPGAQIRAITGQGDHVYEVLGVRYAGDPAPPAVKSGEGRLILQSARGLPYAPSGVVWVDAELVTEPQAMGARLTNSLTLPESHRPLATDTSTVWALVFGLQVLVVVELAFVWSLRRIGPRHTWTVFVPVMFFLSLVITDQVVRLLPNLL